LEQVSQAVKDDDKYKDVMLEVQGRKELTGIGMNVMEIPSRYS